MKSDATNSNPVPLLEAPPAPAVSVPEKQKSLAELLVNLFNFINENITPTYKTLGIFIRHEILKIPGVQ